MNPFQHNNELCFQISPDPYQEHTTPQHHHIHLPLLPDHHHHHPVTSSPDKSIRSSLRSNCTATSPTKKKMIHRDIERQRRQEMAARCASLRSLLPLENIKGKRSISDHMNEAVNYIKQLEKSTSVLGAKRDELRKLSNLRGELVPVGHEECLSRVMVRPMADGIEVLVSSGVTREQDLPLSRVLQIVLQQGLVAVSCCSSKVKDRFLHTIQAQVSDPNCNNIIDPSELQEKLTEAAFQSSSRFSSNFSD